MISYFYWLAGGFVLGRVPSRHQADDAKCLAVEQWMTGMLHTRLGDGPIHINDEPHQHASLIFAFSASLGYLMFSLRNCDKAAMPPG